MATFNSRLSQSILLLLALLLTLSSGVSRAQQGEDAPTHTSENLGAAGEDVPVVDVEMVLEPSPQVSTGASDGPPGRVVAPGTSASTVPPGEVDPDASPLEDGINTPDSLGGFTTVDGTAFPWRTAVRLRVYTNSVDSFNCNGVMVDLKHVLTSGDCVHRNGAWAHHIDVETAGNNYGGARAVHYYSLTSWTQDENPSRNWGLIELDRPVGALTGWLGYGYNSSDSFYVGRIFNNPVYQPTLQNRSGTFDSIQPELFISNTPSGNITNMGGSVGFTDISGNRSVHAVLTRGLLEDTRFARMIESIFNIFQNNIAADIPSQGDLVPLNVQVTPATITAGQPLTSLNFLVHNYSSTNFNGPITIHYYLSTNDNISTIDTYLGSSSGTHSINARQSLRLNHTNPPSLPISLPSGQYWIGAIIQNSDANTSNNATMGWDAAQLTVQAAPPTLVVSPSSLQFTAWEGGSPPAPRTLVIDDAGWGSFSWTASANRGWISLQPASGTNGASVNVSVDPAGLTGPNSGTITINAPGATPSSASVGVSLDIRPPQLNIAPGDRALSFHATLGGGNPPSQTVSLAPDGGSDFNWTAEPASDWISVSPATGSGAANVTVSVDITGLGIGVYPGDANKINFTLRDATGDVKDTAEVEVTLNITAGAPELMISASQLNFSAIAGGINPPSQAVAVYTPIDYPFSWQATIENTPWLPLSLSSGTTPGSFDVAPDITGLSPGAYTTQAIVTSPDDPDVHLTVDIQLTVLDQDAAIPLMQAAPGALHYEAILGEASPPPQTFIIDNVGSGVLQWRATSNAPWLTLSQESGADHAVVTANVNSSDLTAGAHTATITLQDQANNAQTITVFLNVRRPPTLAIDGTQLIYAGVQGEASPPDEYFMVRNAGSGVFQWTATVADPWIFLEPADGLSPEMVRVSVELAGLDVGTHRGDITVHGAGAQNSPQTVNTLLHLRRGPVLGTYPQTIAFDVIAGEPPPDPIAIELMNVSRGNLQWTIEGTSRLNFGQTSGQIPEFTRNPVDVFVESDNIEPREEPYVGQITVRSDNAEASPQTINVLMTVWSPARYCRIPQGGSDYVLNNSYVKLKLENVQRTPSPDGGCDLSARLVADLPQNANLSANVAGHVYPDNSFVPTSSSPLILEIATFELELTDDFSISDEYGIQAEGGVWNIPAEFGGGSEAFNGTVEIGPRGLKIQGSQTFELPDMDYGSFHMNNLNGEVSFSSDGAYLVTIRGNMQIQVSGSPDAVADNFTIVVDRRGLRSGSIGFFQVNNVAGLDLSIHEATIAGGRLNATSAEIKVPDLWGGSEVALYGLSIRNDGSLTVSGGRFRLPEINAGGDSFKLASIEGEFISVPGGGYRISAGAAFGLKGIPSVGSCTLGVRIVIFAGPNGAAVLQIESPEQRQLAHFSGPAIADPGDAHPAATDSMRLEELTISVKDCTPGWAIGATGFFLTGIEGTVVLSSGIEQVTLQLWVSSGVRVGPVPAVSAVPLATIRPEPFSLAFEAPVYVVKVKTQDIGVSIDSRTFETSMTFNYIVFHGGFEVAAGLDSANRFFLNGSGWADVRIAKGSIAEICEPFGIFGDYSCLYVPSSDITLAESTGYLDLNGVSGNIRIAGYRAGFHFDFNTGRLSASRSNLTNLITGAQVAAMRRSLADGDPSLASSLQNAELIRFTSDGDVRLLLPVEPIAPPLSPTDVITTHTHALQSDLIIGLVQPVTGTLSFSLTSPDNTTITPLDLPQDVQYEEMSDATGRQSVYTVQAAMPGVWQLQIDGDTDATPFFIAQLSNTPPPSFAGVRITPTTDPNVAEVQWRLLSAQADTPVSIYANNGDVTTNVSYTGASGETVSGATENFHGVLLAENVPSPTDGSLQTLQVDLSQLPSGAYTFWIEAQGGDAGSSRCYLSAALSPCAEGAASPATIVVDHAAAFPSANTWRPAINPTFDIKAGQMRVFWEPSDHPDVVTYTLRVSAANPLDPAAPIIREQSAFHVLESGEMVNGALGNIEPGRAYTITVGIVNPHSGATVWSPQHTVISPQPAFIMDAPMSSIVAPGGRPTTVPIAFELSSNLPYTISLGLDYDRLPDGIYVEFSSATVPLAHTSYQIQARISASSGVLPGHYVVPLIARSGPTEQMLNLTIEVTSDNRLYLPVIASSSLAPTPSGPAPGIDTAMYAMPRR